VVGRPAEPRIGGAADVPRPSAAGRFDPVPIEEALVVHSSTLPTAGPDAAPGAAACAARRWFLVLAPVLAGLLAIAGAAADPYTGDGAALYEAYAAEPQALQWKATAYHFAYLFWGVAALFLAGLVRRRGSWLANVAGVLALLGLTTMPGFILADFYDSSIGQAFGVDGALQVEAGMAGMWALMVLAGTGALGLVLALPVAALAAWRAGLLAWWGGAAATAGIVVGFFVLGPTVAAGIALTAGFLVLSVALARVAPQAWDGADAGNAAG
jgi:hypothetical protein